MAVFDPGTSGDLKSTTLVKAYFEAVLNLQIKEAALGATDPNNVTLTSDLDGGTVSVNISLPITASINSSGQTLITAANYVGTLGGDATFANGGGELYSTNWAAAAMELAQKLHAAEKAATPEIDNIQITYNLETLVATISGIFPQTPSISSTGLLIISANDYV